jgi:hypothetical protein
MNQISVGGKNIAYSATFAMAEGEQASVFAGSIGFMFDLVAEKVDSSELERAKEIRKEQAHGRLKLTFPFVKSNGASYEVPDLADRGQLGTLAARLATHNAGTTMIVHVDIYIFSPSPPVASSAQNA